MRGSAWCDTRRESPRARESGCVVVWCRGIDVHARIYGAVGGGTIGGGGTVGGGDTVGGGSTVGGGGTVGGSGAGGSFRGGGGAVDRAAAAAADRDEAAR